MTQTTNEAITTKPGLSHLEVVSFSTNCFTIAQLKNGLENIQAAAYNGAFTVE